MMLEIAIIVAGVLMVGIAIATILTRSLLVSVIMSGGVSLLASLVFLLMGAPDVAMTEAVIGSGLTTVVFLYALSRAKQPDDEDAAALASPPGDDTDGGQP